MPLNCVTSFRHQLVTMTSSLQTGPRSRTHAVTVRKMNNCRLSMSVLRHTCARVQRRFCLLYTLGKKLNHLFNFYDVSNTSVCFTTVFSLCTWCLLRFGVLVCVNAVCHWLNKLHLSTKTIEFCCFLLFPIGKITRQTKLLMTLFY